MPKKRTLDHTVVEDVEITAATSSPKENVVQLSSKMKDLSH